MEIKYYIEAADNSGRFERLPIAGYYSFFAIGGVVSETGDINQDEAINILDVVIAVGGILGSEDLSDIQFALADINSDGFLNIQDIILIINIILGR